LRAVARRRGRYRHEVEIEGGHSIVIDEPKASGGDDAGPSATRTLAATLAACTAITCEMYAERKGWELGEVSVTVDMERDARSTITGLRVLLRIPTELDEDQERRLLAIAGKCPVHRALSSETPVAIVDRIESG
jgi:putative redox protein